MRITIFLLFICSFLQAQDTALSRDSSYTRSDVIDGKRYYRIGRVVESEPIDSAQYITNRFNYFIEMWNSEKQASKMLFNLLLSNQQARNQSDELEALTGKDEYALAYDQYKQGYLNTLWLIRDKIADTTYTAILVNHPNQNVSSRLMFRECVYEASNGEFTYTYTLTPQGVRNTVVVKLSDGFEVLTEGSLIPVFYQRDLALTNAGVSRQQWSDATGSFIAIKIGLTYQTPE